MIFNAEFPFNSLSFGQVSINIMYEFYKRGLAPNTFVIGNGIDLSVYDKLTDDFKQYLNSCLNKSLKFYKKNMPYFKLWHISNSWTKPSEPSFLLTFHECSEITDIEANILNSYNGIFVTSSYSKKVFENGGVTVPVYHIKLGFDSLHFRKTDKKYYDDGSIVFAIYGKGEECRKAHIKTIQLWCKKYGNNKNYRLHLHLNNPFFNPEQMNGFYAKIFNNQRPPFNVSILPFQATNSLMNEAYNVCDIVIDMSRGESLSIPLLTCLGIQKHAVVHNCTAMKDYCNEENSVLVNSCGKIPAHDGIFFHKGGGPFNQGDFFDWNDDEFLNACDVAIERFKNNSLNHNGAKLQKEYGYENGVNTILEKMV